MNTPQITDVGDFSLYQKGLTCEINLIAVTVLSTLCVIAAFYGAFLYLKQFFIRCYDSKSLLVFTAQPKSLFPLVFFFYDVTVIIWASLKLTSERHVNGRDVSIQVVNSFQGLFLYSGLILYYFYIINFLKNYVKELNMMPLSVMDAIEMKLTELSIYAWGVIPFSSIFFFMPLIGLIWPKYQKFFAMVYFIGAGVTALYFGLLIQFAARAFRRELSIHIKNVEGTISESDDVKTVLRKFNKSQSIVRPTTYVFCFLTMAFGFSEFLLRKSEYFLLILLIQMPLILILFTISEPRIRREAKIVPTERRRISVATSRS